MNKAENDAYQEKALSGIPEHFSGKLLEVPVGTGILTIQQESGCTLSAPYLHVWLFAGQENRHGKTNKKQSGTL